MALLCQRTHIDTARYCKGWEGSKGTAILQPQLTKVFDHNLHDALFAPDLDYLRAQATTSMEYSYLAYTLFLALVAAAPTSNAIAYVRLVGAPNMDWKYDSTQHSSSSSLPAYTIPLLVGLDLNLSADPPLANEMQIARIAPGGSLEGIEVAEDDARVVCRVTISGSNARPEVRIGQEGALLNEGKRARVTGLKCEVEVRK